MKSIHSPLSPISSLAAKLRRARPGSVLIIVIVLLLLLAILGAAYISTTRSARVSSAQGVLNADVDAMITGLSKACEGVIVDDLNVEGLNNNGLGNLQGVNLGATQNIHSVYQGTFVPGQTYSQGDVVSYLGTPGSPPAIPATPPYFFVAVAAPGASAPTLGLNTPWMQTTHIPAATSSGIQSWLADRIPTPDGPAGATPYWPNITQAVVPPGGALPTSIVSVPFESPDGTPIPVLSPGYTLTGKMGSNLVPEFEKLGTATNPLYVPGMAYGASHLVAGDADGDGIADCLLFRIAGAAYDGLTWYAGVRIIDNNSAVNANTALSRDYEYTIAGGALTAGVPNSNYYSLFQTSVGLYELLNQNDWAINFPKFNAYRVGTVSNAPQADAAPGTNSVAPVPRPEFQFLTGGDLLYHQLMRRINSPGFNGNGARLQALPLSDQAALAYHFDLVNPETIGAQTPSSLIESFLPFSLTYWQKNPTQYYQSIPYGSNPATDVGTWFNDNFNYDIAPPDYPSSPPLVGSQPIRPLLVTRNPVSNYITPVYDSTMANVGEPLDPLGITFPTPYTPPTGPNAGTIPGIMLPYGSGPANYVHYQGPWVATSGNPPTPKNYQFNDVVVGADGYTYIYVCQTSGNTASAPSLATLPPPSASFPGGLSFYQYWQFQPWTKSPVKANVNTATFRELYRAFWSVMAGNPSNQTPFGLNVNIYSNPYGPDAGGPTTFSPQHQFRSPLRDPTYTTGMVNTNVTRMDPENTMLLRAALAAVNTLGLRDNSQNVISRTVYLNAMIAPSGGGAAVLTPVMARVYSSTPQPVISEVYVSTDITAPTNPNGYVAVELYNPYSMPMVLKNWQLGLVNRDASGINVKYPSLSFTTNPTGTPGPSVIAPGTATTTQLQAINDPRPVPVTPATIPPTYGYGNQNVAPGIIILPAHGYALLENYNAGAGATAAVGDATARPPSAGFLLTAGTPVSTGVWYGPGGSASPNTCDVYVPGLQLVIAGTGGVTGIGSPSTGGELVLLRPRRSDGVYTASYDPTNPNPNFLPPHYDPLDTYKEGTLAAPNLCDLVPVDSYDFTGMSTAASGAKSSFSYVRIKGAAPATWFKQIYPGRYTTIPTVAPARQEGTATNSLPEPAITWAAPTGTPAFGYDVLPASVSVTYKNNFPPIQIYNAGPVSATTGALSHFPNPMLSPAIMPGTLGVQSNPTTVVNNTVTPPPLQTPFGTFARNGDMLDIPFIGAYRISQVNAAVNPDPLQPINFVELNSLPMDCSFADAYTNTDAADQNLENIGRFCPEWARVTIPAGSTADYYSWTRNLFSYLTAQSPSDAYLPNVDPNITDGVLTYATPPAPVPNNYKYPPVTPTPPVVPPPSITLTADPTAPDPTSQSNVGVEGLVNINTASWKVLSMLPMITKNEAPGVSGNPPTPNYILDNISLAKAIVAWRNTHGPFLSIYDLNSVIDYNPPAAAGANLPPGFQNAEGLLNLTLGGGTGGVSTLNGLLSPPDPAFPSATTPAVVPPAAPPSTPGVEIFGATATGLSEDYQPDFAMLNRISNLITTRSDTFTVYIVVQGWQNVGQKDATGDSLAQPVITRRYAYIVDRSAINGDPSSRFAKTLTVPND